MTLAGTLTLPRSGGPFPTVILLHGSAPMDRDASMFGHKLFLVWADHLTKQGIAVLRFDKRSAGQSSGDYNTSSLEDFADDVLAGIEYLKTRKEINYKQIGLIGHNKGGMTALLTGVKSKDVAYAEPEMDNRLSTQIIRSKILNRLSVQMPIILRKVSNVICDIEFGSKRHD